MTARSVARRVSMLSRGLLVAGIDAAPIVDQDRINPIVCKSSPLT